MPTRDSKIPAPLAIAIGVLSAIIGLLPWWVTGARLPLQNLWATDTLPDDMPTALLPFSQYALPALIGMPVMSAALAGLLLRVSHGGPDRRATVWAALGSLSVLLTATVQTLIVVNRGLVTDGRATLYVGTVTAVIIVGVVTGILTLWWLGASARPLATVALSLGALALPIWFGVLLAPLGSVPSDATWSFLNALRWVVPVLVGFALAWCGITRKASVVAWVVSVLLLWIVPAALTGLSYAAGSRVVLAYDPAQALAGGLDAFVQALGPAGGSLVTVPIALAVGGLGLLVRRMLSRDAPESSEQAAHQQDDRRESGDAEYQGAGVLGVDAGSHPDRERESGGDEWRQP